jgi:Arc/MetJ-type ribon-helix-helix transcriptional regulator
MLPEKIQVSARIPKTMYDSCIQRYENMTNAINAGLELLLNQSETKNENKCNTNENNYITSENSNEINELKIRVEEKDKQIV